MPLLWLARESNGYLILCDAAAAGRWAHRGVQRFRGVVSRVDAETADAIRELSTRSTWMARGELLQHMHAAGIPDAQAAQILQRTRQDVWRMRVCWRTSPALSEAVDAGQLQGGHLRYLLGMDPSRRQAWAKRVIDEDLTVAALGRRLRGESAGRLKDKPDADTVAYAEALKSVLGTDVEITGGGAGAGTLSLTYFGMASLAGLFEKLSGQSWSDHIREDHKRRLQIEFTSPEELEQLVGHLFKESW